MPQLTRNQIIILVLVVLIACAGMILGALFFMGVLILTEPSPTQTPTVTPSPIEPSPTVEAEDSWLTILEKGEMVVGTAADYPPFAYYTQDFMVDGFDVALIREIGDFLGVRVTIKDMAFDGLSGALQIGQIDAAIAAISVTPERDLVLDFSSAYFVSEDGVLARQDSDIERIDSIEQIAKYRVGVQSGSVYEDWLRSELVETGKLPARDFLTFQLTDQGLDALGEGRIDLFVMDFLPAQEFAKSGTFKVVARSLNRQRYGIAVAQGATSLLNELNRALDHLQANGTISDLVQQYIGIDRNLVPTPEIGETPQPAAPTPTPLGCVDGMAFVIDLTLSDNNMTSPPVVPPGNPFRKGWRIRNTGTCSWDSSYKLDYAGGNTSASQMGGLPTSIVGQVLPGQEYDIFIDMIAPPVSGIYQGFWELQNGSQTAFGDRLSVGITVPPQIPPTQTPVPGIYFVAAPTNIESGERVIFNWRVDSPKAVFFYEQGQPWQQNPVSPIGGREVYPSFTTVYVLRVVRQDDSVETRQIVIFVTSTPGAPTILEFKISPGGVIPVGTCVEISWVVQGNVKTVNVYRDGGYIWNGAPTTGSIESCIRDRGSVVFSIDAIGPGGTTSQAREVETIE